MWNHLNCRATRTRKGGKRAVFGKHPPARVKVATALICSVVVDAEEEVGEDEGERPRASRL